MYSFMCRPLSFVIEHGTAGRNPLLLLRHCSKKETLQWPPSSQNSIRTEIHPTFPVPCSLLSHLAWKHVSTMSLSCAEFEWSTAPPIRGNYVELWLTKFKFLCNKAPLSHTNAFRKIHYAQMIRHCFLHRSLPAES